MSRHLNEQLIDAACRATVTIKKLIAAGADPNYLTEQINTLGSRDSRSELKQ